MPNSIYPFLKNIPGESRGTNNGGGTDHYVLNPGERNDELKMGVALSIALISPDDHRREAVALALRAFPSTKVRDVSVYPSSIDKLPMLVDDHDAVIIDLDGDPEYALELVERISVRGTATVMVFSAEASPDKLMRSMRAGAREFLTIPVEKNIVAEALLRASARRPATIPATTAIGKLLTFMGAKGGVGVTTLACNFALALAQESTKRTLLIDLAVPLGDVALNLGVQSEYSTVNALQAADRLDVSFLSKLLVKHPSGLAVLPGPGNFVPDQFTSDTIAKLVAVARQSFEYVVVDAGSRLDLTEMSLFKDASTIYLVAQVGVAELRNSNRLISQFLKGTTPKIEIVLNRYNPRSTTVPEDYIAKVLTKAPSWKIPNDYSSVQRVQIAGTPLVPGDSPISQVIQEMARAVTGQPAPKRKRSAFSFFG